MLFDFVKTSAQAPRFGATSNMRCFGGSERVKTVVMSSQLNICVPALVTRIPKNTFISRRIIFLRASVLMVLGRCCLPQIFPFIIRRVLVAMINFVFGPLTGHPKPDYSVSQIPLVVDANPDISKSSNAAYRASRFYVVARRYFPSKNSSFSIIGKSLSNLLRGEIAKRVFRPAFHFDLTSSIARRITSASVMPSFIACVMIHLCWDFVSTIPRWIPAVMIDSCSVDNRTRLYRDLGGVK